MKVILPLARIENAYKRVDGYSPMLVIAGKPIIAHLLDQVIPLKPQEVIFIVGDVDKEVISYVKENCKVPFRFIKQKSAKGSAHAIYGAKNFVKGPVMILFGDTLFSKSTTKSFNHKDNDCIIWVSDVLDPRSLGVVFMDNGYASKLIEKPDEPVSNLAMIGLYSFKDADVLFDNIKYLLDNNIMTKGSFHLTDAIQLMINKGLRVKTAAASDWIDVDAQGGVLRANEYLCKLHAKVLGETKDTVIIPPVFVAKGAVIKNSVVGPNVSVAAGAKIVNSIVRSSIISAGASVRDSGLDQSVIGDKARVKGQLHKLNLIDSNQTLVD